MKTKTRIRLDQAEVMELSKSFRPLNEAEQKRLFTKLIGEAIVSQGTKRETLLHVIHRFVDLGED